MMIIKHNSSLTSSNITYLLNMFFNLFYYFLSYCVLIVFYVVVQHFVKPCVCLNRAI